MGVKLKHSSGNGTVIGAPAANPSADITLKAPSTTGSAGQVLAVASANHSSTNAELEWVANSAGTGRKILEQFYTPCDGSVIATSAGNITIGDADAVQDLTTTYADVTGSSIAYTPPAGTTQVIYEFNFKLAFIDSGPLSHFKFFIDSDEVSDARTTYAGTYRESRELFKWGINIGGSAVTATGRLASWSSAKTLKLQAREYTASNEAKIHEKRHWDGGSSNQFSRACIGITAIG